MTYDRLVFIFAICLCLSLCLCLSWFSLSSPLRREQSDMIYEQGSFVEQAKLMLLFHLERRGEQFNVKGTKLSQWSQTIHMIKMISLVMMLILISLVHGNNVQCFVKMQPRLIKTRPCWHLPLLAGGAYIPQYIPMLKKHSTFMVLMMIDWIKIVKMISKTILLSEVMMNLMITGHLVLEYYHRPRQSVA